MKKPPRLIPLTLSFACLLCFVLAGASDLCPANPDPLSLFPVLKGWMKMKKPPRLIPLTLSFACLLCFVLAGASCSANPSAGSDPIGSYELYYTLNDQDQTVVEDPDWENPQNAPLAISMTKSSGPTKCSVIVYHKEDSASVNDQDQTVVEDPDWENPQNAPLAISMTKSSGPTKCSVIVYHKEDSASGWITAGSGVVILGGPACSFTIPENHTVRVVAKATAGNNGYATLQVSLK